MIVLSIAQLHSCSFSVGKMNGDNPKSRFSKLWSTADGAEQIICVMFRCCYGIFVFQESSLRHTEELARELEYLKAQQAMAYSS